MTGTAYRQLTFSSVEESARRLAETVARRVPPHRPTRVLDLGCGTGRAVLGLARLRPEAEVVGVDISITNVAEAQRLAAGAGHGDRVRFVATDYMEFADAPFDVIYSETVLHLIAAPTRSVIRKLGSDLRPSGSVVLIMPYACLYNWVLIAVRRVFQVLRGRPLDRLILAVAKRLYREWPEALLRERVSYMYIVPVRLESPTLRSLMRECGLSLVEVAPWPNSSVGKLKHRLTVFRKAEASSTSE